MVRALPLVLALAGAQPAVETTVTLTAPDAGRARTVFRSPAPEHRALSRGETWELETVRPDAAGAVETEVAPGPDGWFRVPVPLPESGDLDFAGSIHAPAGYRVEDPFPTRLDLPAPPSFLRFRVVPDDAPALTLARAVDFATLAALLALAGFGAFRATRSP